MGGSASYLYKWEEQGVKVSIPLPQAPDICVVIDEKAFEEGDPHDTEAFTIVRPLVNFQVTDKILGSPVPSLEPLMRITVCFTAEEQEQQLKLGYWTGNYWEILWDSSSWKGGPVEECPFNDTPYAGAVTVLAGGSGWADPAMAWGT